MAKKKPKLISETKLRTLRKNNLLKAYDNAVKNGHLSEKEANQLKKEMISDYNKKPEKRKKT